MKLEQFTFLIFFVVSTIFHTAIFMVTPKNSTTPVQKRYTYLEVYKTSKPHPPQTISPLKEFKPKIEQKKKIKSVKIPQISKPPVKKNTQKVLSTDSSTKKNVVNTFLQKAEERPKPLEDEKQTFSKYEIPPLVEDGKQPFVKDEPMLLKSENSTKKITYFDLEAYAAYVKDFLQKNITYPYIARKRNIEGELLVEVVVEADGRLSDYKILKTSGYKVLDENAANTLNNLILLRKPDLKVTLQFNLVYRLD